MSHHTWDHESFYAKSYYERDVTINRRDVTINSSLIIKMVITQSNEADLGLRILKCKLHTVKESDLRWSIINIFRDSWLDKDQFWTNIQLDREHSKMWIQMKLYFIKAFIVKYKYKDDKKLWYYYNNKWIEIVTSTI